MRPAPILETALAIALTLSCGPTRPPSRAETAPRQSAPAKAPAAMPYLDVMDRNADPCADFYRYACGGWIDRTTIPPDQSRWGRSGELRERNREMLREILESVAAAPGDDPDRKRLGDFYTACMDEDGIEKEGIQPIVVLLQKIGKVRDRFTFMTMVGTLHGMGVPVLFRVSSDGDYKEPSRTIAYFTQGGLGLPDRDYYVKDDAKSKETLEAYRAHVKRMFELSGQPASLAATSANEVVAFETELATVQLPRAELRNPETRYNKIDLAGLRALERDIPWDTFLKSAGLSDVTDISVATPDVFKKTAGILLQNRQRTLSSYLRFHVLRSVAELLGTGFQEESFAFNGKILAGQKEMPPRWKRCVNAADAALGEILGKLYVERAFAGNSKATAEEMILGIESSFRDGLERIDWMDAPTRRAAETKLEAVANKVGHPETWRDYGSLEMEPDTHLVNVLAARQFEFRRRMAEVGKPQDRNEWSMTPPTVNAYYDSSVNQMVFPAGILQAPFFDAAAPPAVNYGGIGMVMGHELSHGFDDSGRKFDGTGRMTEWWSPGVVSAFEERAACVRELYGSYEVQPGVPLNGKLTLGENIADLGGVKLAYRAWRDWYERNGKPDPGVPGLTADQLFFVGFAQSWCSLSTPESERLLVKTDSHSPPRFRVNGPLSNFPEFGKAFRCEEGTPMRPATACSVW